MNLEATVTCIKRWCNRHGVTTREEITLDLGSGVAGNIPFAELTATITDVHEVDKISRGQRFSIELIKIGEVGP